MVTNIRPSKVSYALNQFPSDVMFGMNGFHISASGAIQGHHGPLVLVTFALSSANVFNLDCFNSLLFGKELTHSLLHHFESVSNSKKLQTTTDMWLLKAFKIRIA